MMKHMRIWAVLASFLVFFYIPQSYAGVALGATRVIYPEGQKQVQLAVTNNDDKSSYLIQSWIENAEEKGCPVCNYSSVIFHAGKEREYPENY